MHNKTYFRNPLKKRIELVMGVRGGGRLITGGRRGSGNKYEE